ncbi:hypothetical protein [Hansschlegelia plantiphila]|uniref:Uncharacterized protein n=1 Tax=Hansschlegelia plantiphila TaxID=374655 RepID=A0A9W6J439_9HYPH|nr:hypothetical protein [Hansschlegelia plantiphila]GLK68969.1 hypothetical protein GCM10008179_26070 [Hansschlegelia plantiphila]
MTARKRGRPAFKPTLAQRKRVSQAAAAGWSHNRIALGIEIDVDTLRKHFATELEHGGAKHSIEALDLLWKQARGGNVSATKKLIELNEVGAAAGALRDREKSGTVDAPSVPAPAEKLGKKEEAQRAAEQIGGIYATPAAPKLVVNND